MMTTSALLARTSCIEGDDDDVCFVGENKLYWRRWWRRLLCWIFIVLAHWNNSLHVDMLLHSWHIILILNQPVIALTLKVTCLVEKKKLPTLVLGFTWKWLEPTINCTRGKYGNHYTTGVVGRSCTPRSKYYFPALPCGYIQVYDTYCPSNISV